MCVREANSYDAIAKSGLIHQALQQRARRSEASDNEDVLKMSVGHTLPHQVLSP
jgi:hypothetical protein